MQKREKTSERDRRDINRRRETDRGRARKLNALLMKVINFV